MSKKENPGITILAISQQSELDISRIINDKYLNNEILHPRVQRPGLALAGYTDFFDHTRLQIFGRTEMGYLNHLKNEEREKSLKKFLGLRVAGIIISENLEPQEKTMELAFKNKTPLLVSRLKTSLLISRLSALLYRHFSEKIRVNGVLISVLGQGIMLIGKSGVGKSETALELVNKGHQLISDDLIEFYLDPNDEPVGRAVNSIKKWLEVRGLGIINMVDIFGFGALQAEKKLDLVINLEDWDPKKKYDRLGENILYYNILGKDIPMFIIPVATGRNIATLIEVAVKYFLGKKNGSVPFIDHIYQKGAND